MCRPPANYLVLFLFLVCISVCTLFFVGMPLYKNFNHSYFFQASHPTVSNQLDNNRNSFPSTFKKFQWDSFEEAVTKYNVEAIEAHTEDLIEQMSYFVATEPPVPINKTCKVPSLVPSGNVNCSSSKYSSGFSGLRKLNVSKIGVLIQFGFDVDVLEIYLNELYDVVDQFFIIESTRAHFRTLRKPLMWANVKSQTRFSTLADKVTHFIIDDAENAWINEMVTGLNSTPISRMWGMEKQQEMLRWKKFIEWNNIHKLFMDEDFLGFGDADEIPARNTINLLKYCELQLNAKYVNIGIWFPFGNINQAFATDFPVPGHKFTLGDPTFWTLKSANETFFNGFTPTRMRGQSRNFLLGGMHMSHYGFLPFRIVKRLTASEGAYLAVGEVQAYRGRFVNDQIREFEVEQAALPVTNKDRTFKLTEVGSIEPEIKDIAILPWFYDCNRARYPVWEGGHDLRLD